MTQKFDTPAHIDDSALDEISGGPHFKTWSDIHYDYGSSDEITSHTIEQADAKLRKKLTTRRIRK